MHREAALRRWNAQRRASAVLGYTKLRDAPRRSLGRRSDFSTISVQTSCRINALRSSTRVKYNDRLGFCYN